MSTFTGTATPTATATASADGFRGSLLTRHFVSHVLMTEFAGRLGEASVAAVRRRCARRVREAHDRLGPASSVRAICEVGAAPLFAQVGYAVRSVRIDRPDDRHDRSGQRHDPPGDLNLLIASLEGTHGVTLTLVISPWQERLDRVWRAALQAGLNGRQRWCVCFNGHQLRVVDVDRPYARRFLEFDLPHAVDDERTFQLLWALLRPAAFATSTRAPALVDQIVAACDAHGGSIRQALQHGVRQALTSLATALSRASKRSRTRTSRSGPASAAASVSASASASAPASTSAAAAAAAADSASAADVVGQALTVIYRLLFLLFAEARALVPVWHPVYRDSYSIGALHALAEANTRARVRGLWPAVQAISRLAHEGCAIDDLSVTAFNGQLFSPEHTPLGEHLQIPSVIIAEVLDALMTTPARGRRGRERITYADLGVEQLGTVYERVLDYAPALEGDISEARSPTPSPTRSPTRLPTQRPPRRGVERSSARRKESGSFYTPRSMADYLVRATLAPLVADATADDILSLRVLDPSMGSGAFLVSACRFLAQAHDHARERDGGGGVDPRDVRRHVARHCLFGVDVNPMAVQLARLSLWLTTMTRDAPLTFLDHHLRVGDSLVGVSLEDLVRHPAAMRGGGRQRLRHGHARAAGAELPLFSGDEHATALRAILPARAALAAVDDSAATVREKERLLQSLARESALARWLQLADAWCAAWFAGDARGAGVAGDDAQSVQHSALPAGVAAAAAPGAGAPARAWPAISDYLLHGQAAFPPATLDAWLAAIRRCAERRRFFHWTLEFPEVFFDEHGQPLAGGAGFDAIVGNPPWDMIRNDALDDGDGDGDRKGRREAAALSRFVREAGLYRSAGDAHFNCYQLFVERTLTLLKRGGRFGLVLPWGIAADHGSARLRRRLLESCDLDTLVVFENNRAIFPIHRSTRFALVSGTTGRATHAVRCRFGERDPAVLDTLDTLDTFNAPTPAPVARPGLVMSVDFLRRVSGEGLGFPDARTPMDLVLLERLHATFPALHSADGWHAKFGRELNVSEDRALFSSAPAPAPAPAPASASASASASGAASASPASNRMPVIDGKHLRPFAVSLDRLTLTIAPEHVAALTARLPDIARPRLAFRDIASPTNKLTLIAAMLPAGVVSTHTVSCLKAAASMPLDAQWCLCALLNSFVANYLIRMRVSTHVTLALTERMPVPKPRQDSSHFRELADLAKQLRDTSGEAYARLQAIAARAYALSRDEFHYVLTKFPSIEEDTKRAALEAFQRRDG